MLICYLQHPYIAILTPSFPRLRTNHITQKCCKNILWINQDELLQLFIQKGFTCTPNVSSSKKCLITFVDKDGSSAVKLLEQKQVSVWLFYPGLVPCCPSRDSCQLCVGIKYLNIKLFCIFWFTSLRYLLPIFFLHYTLEMEHGIKRAFYKFVLNEGNLTFLKRRALGVNVFSV